MDLNKLTLGDKLAAAGALALVLFALFFDWHRVCIDIPFSGEVCEGLGVFSGDGDAIPVLGILAFLLGLAVLVAVLVRKLTTTDLPDLPVPWRDAIFYAAVAALVLLLLKLVLKFDYIGFGAYLMIIAAAVMAYGGFLIRSDPDDAAPGGTTGTAPF